jgi:uncharacterized caspase-like protein
MKPLLTAIAVGALALVPTFAAARDAALIVVESNYDDLPGAPGVSDAATLARALQTAGFQVTTSIDAPASDLWEAAEVFRDDATLADRVVILLAGHIVHTARDSWLLAADAGTPSDLSIGAAGLPLDAVLDIAAEHPGQAVVMLAPSGADLAGPGVTSGETATAPQGVTLLT